MSETIQTVKHSKSGASFQIHPFGATLLSYKSADGREHLFVSRDAKLDGTKAIRGGIPLVFPIFGPPEDKDQGNTMPQHGFARGNPWKIHPDSLFDDEAYAGLTLTLDLDDTVLAGRGEHNPWSIGQARLKGRSCRLTCKIKIDSNTLTTTMVVENTGTDAFPFQMLLHTYYAVDGKVAQTADQCHVNGLGGYTIIDKVDSTKTGAIQSDDEPVILVGEVDSVYVPPETHNTVEVKIAVGNGKSVTMKAYGEVDETNVPVSCVVWNPGQVNAAGMSDFGSDQYTDMICVEPGLLGRQPLLSPGKEASLTQIIFT